MDAAEKILQFEVKLLVRAGGYLSLYRRQKHFLLLRFTEEENGRCGEESVFTVNAMRSVGIPARQYMRQVVALR